MIQLFGFRENYYLQHMENGKSNIPKILVVDDEKKGSVANLILKDSRYYLCGFY